MAHAKLASPVTPLLGRARELATVAAALGSSSVVTLWGPAGIGKTSLARAAVEALPGQFVFCSLALCTAETGVAAEVAKALGLHGAAGSEEECLAMVAKAVEHIDRTLIVLDNVEQVVDEVAELVRELVSDDARFLVTSREPLQIAGELVVPVPPLALPSDRDPDAPAAQLFRLRAAAASPDAPKMNPDCERAIVARLGGIPLAIELAAARLDVLTVEELAARLDEWPTLLRSGRRDIDERHRTLVRAIDLSFELLRPEDATAAAELSLFRGRFDMGAATAVLGGPAEDRVQSLVRKSLLGALRTEHHVWFSMLPTVREFALQRIPSGAPARARYATFVLGRARAAKSRFETAQGAAELAELQEDLEAVAERSPPREGLEALALLWPLAVFRGPIVSFASRIADRLDATRDDASVTPEVRAEALRGSGEAHYATSSLDRAQRDFEELCRVAPDAAHRAQGLLGVGRTLNAQGRSREGEARLREGIALAEPLGDAALSCDLWTTLGTVLHHRGELADARAYYTRSIPLAQGPHLLRKRALLAIKLGFLEHDAGNPVAARASFAEARDAFAAVEDARYAAHQWGYFGNTYRAEGNVVEAERHYREAVDRLGRIGDRMFEGVFTMDLGALYLTAGRFDEARAALLRAHDLLGASRRGHLGVVHAGYAAIARVLAGDREAGARDLAEAAVRVVDAPGAAYLAVHGLTLRAEGARSGATANGRAKAAKDLAKELAALPPPVNDHVRVAMRVAEHSLAALRGEALVHRDGGFVSAAGGDVPLKGPLGLLFHALLDARRATPGAPLSTAELLRAGWPAERVLAKAGAIRVRVSIAKLRALGLGTWLRSEGGYFLDPKVPLRRALDPIADEAPRAKSGGRRGRAV